jgi:hypothetical protein
MSGAWEIFPKRIRASGLTIYDPIVIGSELWIPAPELQAILNRALRGLNLTGLALRSRSKRVKECVAEALGYPVPQTFVKTQPRFPGQSFDTYIQKSNNLQVWNEELSATRRYVLVRVDDNSLVTSVKVVTGDTLALLDTTGTLTQKYQASLVPGAEPTELISAQDTDRVLTCFGTRILDRFGSSPTDNPTADCLLPITEIFRRISPLVGRLLADPGIDQERNRGGALHREICQALGYARTADDGRFPDVRHQLLEVKLQTSRTIDLGLVTPSSEEVLDVPQINGVQIRHCDVRYALFYGRLQGQGVALTHCFLTTGRDFFSRFPQFAGRVLNKKLQIPLPRNFFTTETE